jgi:hypothetical protein
VKIDEKDDIINNCSYIRNDITIDPKKFPKDSIVSNNQHLYFPYMLSPKMIAVFTFLS